MEQKIWGFFLRISDHMWEDGSNADRSTDKWYLPDSTYREENNISMETWDAMVKFLAERQYNLLMIDIGDGVKFDSHPEISAPDAWSKELLRKKIEEARTLGLEVIPKLNFSTAHDTWMKQYNRMISTPTYYKVCADLIAEMCELFDHPRLFHLGLDEENFQNQQGHEMIIIRGEKLYWHDSYFLFKECEKNGARPWVWSDYYWHHPELFIKYMPKEVLQSNWHYGTFRDYDPTKRQEYYRIKAYNDLSDMGYDQILTSASYERHDNAYQTVAHAKNTLSDDSVKGFITSPWMGTHDSELYLLQHDAHRLYLARKALYPDTLR